MMMYPYVEIAVNCEYRSDEYALMEGDDPQEWDGAKKILRRRIDVEVREQAMMIWESTC